jgi:HD-GYP domain-containing protein (c-di-GMP phosphodiesterase class II)
MEGFFVNELDAGIVASGPASADIKLLAKRDEMEIMSQRLAASSTVWLVPADDEDTLEFFFVHSGELEILVDGVPRTFVAGESFYISGLRQDMLVRAKKDALLLYVANRPMFQDTLDFERDHERLLEQIQEKDHYTHTHSLSVMHYAVKLFEALQRAGLRSDISVDDMVIASTFHDIGKCYVPDEILKKKGPLTPSEMRSIYHHPIDSARLLEPEYGERVAEIARNHHEREDGSGYPFGLTGAEISTEAKILAVADCFDAMTTDRGYNRVMSYEEAAVELAGLTDKLDARITALLLQLVRSGEIRPPEKEDDRDKK